MHIDDFSPAAAGPLEDDDAFDIVAEPAIHYYHAFLQSFDLEVGKGRGSFSSFRVVVIDIETYRKNRDSKRG